MFDTPAMKGPRLCLGMDGLVKKQWYIWNQISSAPYNLITRSDFGSSLKKWLPILTSCGLPVFCTKSHRLLYKMVQALIPPTELVIPPLSCVANQSYLFVNSQSLADFLQVFVWKKKFPKKKNIQYIFLQTYIFKILAMI